MTSKKSKTVLLIAFHFPPLGESSGLQRTLSLANDLVQRGWQPIVLSVSKGAYRRVRGDQLGDIDPRVKVCRAFCFDSSRALAVAGRYPRLVALPDVWSSWLLTGFLSGLWLVFRHRPRFVWSTYPIATSHLLAYLITKTTSTPWIADFRDSMTEEGYPADPMQNRAYQWIEGKTVRAARRSIFTTPGTLEMYQTRYPSCSAFFSVIANGYEERYFQRIVSNRKGGKVRNQVVTLLHSGVVYPSERDPRQMFDALRTLKAEGLDGSRFRVVLRASGFETALAPLIRQAELEDVVLLMPPIGYQEALQEMVTVDGLLVLQASNCNHQIPAKVYEYIRSGTPIIALTDPVGDTAGLIEEIGGSLIAPLDDAAAISDLIRRFVLGVESDALDWTPVENVSRFSREKHALVLEEIVETSGR